MRLVSMQSVSGQCRSLHGCLFYFVLNPLACSTNMTQTLSRACESVKEHVAFKLQHDAKKILNTATMVWTKV